MKWLNLVDLAAFVEILVFTAQAQKRLFRSLHGKILTSAFIGPYFLINFGDLRTFSTFQLNFSSDKLNVRRISTSGLFDLQT